MAPCRLLERIDLTHIIVSGRLRTISSKTSMAGLAESVWASAPDAPSISTGQNTKKSSRETRTSGTKAPPRGAQTGRGRVRGGGSARPTRQAASSDVRTPFPAPSGLATEPCATSELADVPPSPAAPRNAPNGKAKPESARTTGRVIGTASAKTSLPEKDVKVVSEPVPSETRKIPRKRGGKTLPAKRKASLAVSVSTTEPLSPTIEPATPLSQSAGAVTASIVAKETIAAPDSPKTASHSSGSETLPPSTPVPDQEHQLLKPLPVVVPDSASTRPLTPASTSHIDWADDDAAGDLPDLDDWGFTPGKPELVPKPQAQRRKSSAAKAARQDGVPKFEDVVIPVVSEDPQPHRPDITEIHASSMVMVEDNAPSPAENPPVAAAAPRPKGVQPRPPLTEAQMAEKKKLRNERAKERRKIKKIPSNEGNDVPAPSNPKAVLESRSGIQGVASQISKLVVDDGKPTTGTTTPKYDVAAPANVLPLKPSQPPLPAKPATSDNPPNSTSLKALWSPAKPPASLLAHPAHPRTSSPAPPSNSVTPSRRKPFGGEPTFDASDRPRNNRGYPSASPRPNGRGRPLSVHHAHSVSRPVISPNALNQLTKSLSGGTRTHRPAVTAE